MRNRTHVVPRRRTRALSWTAAALAVAGSPIAVSTAGSRAEAKTTAVQPTAARSTALSATASPATPLWSTQLDFDDDGTPWSEASFAALKADGLTTAEIDMPWNTIEPAPGTFSFTELDQELANAAAAGMKLVPIFWSSGWGGSPAAWVTSHEVNGSGAQGTAPAWWDPTAEPAYVAYVTGAWSPAPPRRARPPRRTAATAPRWAAAR
jgi:GH35 family endo-1,4-beta-xylanase